ncbi:MAG: hypothetical protein HY912_16585 [Desulfomonile tiedjei]|uniref:Nickel transport protein n=1 Tax=Desulfomonile tiedjei TaxID=2358 RepID=A0A9D6V8U9_9BACT|nr:hypothetical protein [Desulfomonile tiedjei]
MVNSSNCVSGMAPRIFAVLMVTMMGMCVMAVQAQAHKVNLFAYVEGDRVIVEGYFSAKSRAQDCLVEVFDEGGKKIHEGKTDEKGMYSFKLGDFPAFTGGLKIVLEAGMGHKTEYTLSVSDIPGSAKKDGHPTEQPGKNQPEALPGPPVGGSAQVADQAALIAAMEKALEKKLEPIVKMLGNQERLLLEEKYGGPRINDIVGGIGWIVGMVGMAAFFVGRNRSGKN